MFDPWRSRYRVLILLAVGFLLPLGAESGAAPDAVVDISITPEQINWTPRATAREWLLTVSGRGFYLRRLAAEGEPLQLHVLAVDGEPLPDGGYTWELRAVIPSSTAAKGVGRQDARPRPRSRTWLERRPSERPIVTSGSFRLINREFAVPILPDRTQAGYDQQF